MEQASQRQNKLVAEDALQEPAPSSLRHRSVIRKKENKKNEGCKALSTGGRYRIKVSRGLMDDQKFAPLIGAHA